MDIPQEQTLARERAEAWQNEQTQEFPYLELDHICDGCAYVCKKKWRFAGLKLNGSTYTVGPMCDVLWKFSPLNPLHR